MYLRKNLRVLLILAWVAAIGVPEAPAEDLSAGPYTVYEVFDAEIPYQGCKLISQKSLDKTTWTVPHGAVRLLGNKPVQLHDNAFLIEDEPGVIAIDSYENVLAVQHDGSVNDVLQPGNVVAGSFGVREIVGVSQKAGAINDFAPRHKETLKELPRKTRFREAFHLKGGPLNAGFAEVETRDVALSELLCDADIEITWNPIPEPITTTPAGGSCEGHSPCDLEFPIVAENAYPAPSFDPLAPEDSLQFREGGVFNCPKAALGKFQIKPRIRFQAPQIVFTLRIFQGVARLDGSAGVAAGVLVSVQEEALVKMRCEADFLRMAMPDSKLEVELANFTIFGVKVFLYLKPFVTGWFEVSADTPRLEVDLGAGLFPTLALGWDGGALANFNLNPEFDAAVTMESPSSSDPWGANLASGIDFGAEVGLKFDGSIFGIGADIHLYVKPFERFSSALELTSHQPCLFTLDATVGTYLKFGVRFVLKVIWTILSKELESLPIPLTTLELFEREVPLAAFGCEKEPQWQIPIGGIAAWQCGARTEIFAGSNAEQACLDAWTADPTCQGTIGYNPHGNTCSPVGGERNFCSPCAASGFAGTWTYDVYDCSCGKPQACEYPCCVANEDCFAGELCNQDGLCEATCKSSGDTCQSAGDCCSGVCECTFGCGSVGPNILTCG